MSSQISRIARNVRLQEWADMIHECNNRPDDMTVTQWCSEHGISKCNYYYRLAVVRKVCLDKLSPEVKQAVVPVPARKDMARWTIQCAERYISILYDYLHREMYKYHLLQADEPPVRVTKENRSDGSQHYMWVYRTVRTESGGQIVLYEYQPTRRADHPREFLKNFSGICITDGYQIYHTIESEWEDLRIAGCYAHARRRFDEALKAVPEESRKSSLAYLALKQIQSIYHEDKKLADLSAEERVLHRRLTVKPLVDALFAWTKQNQCRVSEKSKTGKGFAYLLNQEKYLRVFLEDGNVPLDNNAAEQAIRPFCIGKKNWVMIDTIAVLNQVQ